MSCGLVFISNRVPDEVARGGGGDKNHCEKWGNMAFGLKRASASQEILLR